MAFSVLIIEDEAISKLKIKTYNAAIVDRGLSDISGDELIKKAYSIRPDVKYFIYTGDNLYKPSEELISMDTDKTRVIFKPVFDMMTIYNKITDK